MREPREVGIDIFVYNFLSPITVGWIGLGIPLFEWVRCLLWVQNSGAGVYASLLLTEGKITRNSVGIEVAGLIGLSGEAKAQLASLLRITEDVVDLPSEIPCTGEFTWGQMVLKIRIKLNEKVPA